MAIFVDSSTRGLAAKVQQLIDMFAEDLTITSFTNNRNSVEVGSTVTSTTLTWVINNVVTTQSLNQSIGSIDEDLRTYDHTDSYTTNRTYTLTVSDGTTTDTANTTISFLRKMYWGVNSGTTINDAGILALSGSQFATSRSKTFTVSPSSQYIYFAYPASFGTATFHINNFLVNDFVLSVQDHTNASGSTVSYNVYRTNNVLTGTYTIEVS